ncbi:MAG: hypothetical protein K2Z81_03325, partial [Cyanobacteria bacterium]|nr:hypothetical protein [Cyanobacteriota bacterium]
HWLTSKPAESRHSVRADLAYHHIRYQFSHASQDRRLHCQEYQSQAARTFGLAGQSRQKGSRGSPPLNPLCCSPSRPR